MQLSRLPKSRLYQVFGVAIGLLLVVAVAAGCAKGGGTSTSSGGGTDMTGGGGGDQVSIKDFSYNPSTLTVKKGTTVTWTNNDSPTHTVSVDNPTAQADFDQQLDPGDTFKFKFDNAGTFPYHCNIHSSMHGTVIVE